MDIDYFMRRRDEALARAAAAASAPARIAHQKMARIYGERVSQTVRGLPMAMPTR